MASRHKIVFEIHQSHTASQVISSFIIQIYSQTFHYQGSLKDLQKQQITSVTYNVCQYDNLHP